MAITVIGPPADDSGEIPAYDILVQTKKDWNDSSWINRPDLRWMRITNSIAGHGVDRCELTRHYGKGAEQWQTGKGTIKPLGVLRSWIRLVLLDPNGKRLGSWTGWVTTESRAPEGRFGEEDNEIITGKQTWEAYGSLWLLERIDIIDSWCFQPDAAGTEEDPLTNRKEKILEWIPPMNVRTDHGITKGNRSVKKSVENEDAGINRFRPTYLYGGNELWSRYEYLEYIIERLVNRHDSEGNSDGPAWSISGDKDAIDALKALKDSIVFPRDTPRTAGKIIRDLISRSLGLDYKVKSNADGFELYVFSLQHKDESFYGETLKANPNRVRLPAAGAADNLTVALTWNSDFLHDVVHFVGKRIVVCCSLFGSEVESPHTIYAGSLMPLWDTSGAALAEDWTTSTSDAGAAKTVTFAEPFDEVPNVAITLPAGTDDKVWVVSVSETDFVWNNDATGGNVSIEWAVGGQEVEYLAGLNDSRKLSSEHDAVRSRSELAVVYRHYGIPVDWNHHNGKVAISCDHEAALFDYNADWQNHYLSTLPSLPLLEGFDYSVSPPIDHNTADHHPDYRRIAVYLWDIGRDEGEIAQYVDMAESRVTAAPLNHTLGIRLGGISPASILAAGRFFGSTAANEPMPSGGTPRYDEGKMIATVAFETDQRVSMEYTNLSADKQDGSVKIVLVPDAELWIVAAGTIVGVNEDGTLATVASAGAEGIEYVLRHNISKLALAMCGAVAAYYDERARAEIAIQGIAPYADLLGHILTDVEEGADILQINGVISEVEWIASNPEDSDPMPARTILRTGYYRR